MKAIILLISIFLSQLIFTQNSCRLNDEPVLYIYADKLPKFSIAGGLKDYVYSNVQWPNQFDGQGTVIVSFVVLKDGKVSNVRIEKSLYSKCDEEVVRVFSSMPDWEPGQLNTENIDIKLYFPVVFKLR